MPVEKWYKGNIHTHTNAGGPRIGYPNGDRAPTAIQQRLQHGTGATTMISWFSQTTITVPYWNTAPADGDFENP